LVVRKLARARQQGLTLVEFLVVIVILALASTVVLLNAPPSRPEVREDAERFAARMQLAFDEAITSGENARVSIDAAGYEFQVLRAGEWANRKDDRLLSRARINARSVMSIVIADGTNENARALGVEERDVEDEEDDGAFLILLDPLGSQTPFRARFASPDGAWVVTVTDAASVSVKQDA
jgi:type II secretion system protein H